MKRSKIHRVLGGQSDGLKRVGRREEQCAPIKKERSDLPRANPQGECKGVRS